MEMDRIIPEEVPPAEMLEGTPTTGWTHAGKPAPEGAEIGWRSIPVRSAEETPAEVSVEAGAAPKMTIPPELAPSVYAEPEVIPVPVKTPEEMTEQEITGKPAPFQEPHHEPDLADLVTQVDAVPITRIRPVAHDFGALVDPGKARATVAADKYFPAGVEQHPHDRTVLQQHVDFFDRNKDGIITPIETYQGFRALGFGIFWSLMSIPVIHPAFSFYTAQMPWYFPIDPLLRIWVDNIHRAKHGSDTGVYDTEGRFIPQKFEEIFSKFQTHGDEFDFWNFYEMSQYLFVANDFFGWFAAKFEWFFSYLLLADERGLVSRDKIRGLYDGTIFYAMEQEHLEKLHRKKKQ